MTWLSKILPPKVKHNPSGHKVNMPEGLWCKCENCNDILYHTDLDNNLKVCPKCDYHHPLTARERLNMLLEADGQMEIGVEITPVDILKFVDTKKYSDRLEQAKENTGENDALVVMQGFIQHIEVVVASFEFRFIGGSMGSVVGEKFVRGVRQSLERDCPFICVAASGGARMQEGLSSLMQMAKTCASLNWLAQKRLPFISILSNPTMGGVSASFAFLGDVVVAEPGALIGFAGPRVIEQTVREKLPKEFQRSEFLLDKGAIDMVVHRKYLRQEISNMLILLTNREFSDK